MSLAARRTARIHKLLGLAIGLQFLFWTASGLYFTLFPIDVIHGDHLRRELPPADLGTLGTATVPQLGGGAERLELTTVLGEPVWRVTLEAGPALYSAATGDRLATLDEAGVRQIAQAEWAGTGAISSVDRVEHPPRETFSERPLWRVQFDGADRATFWVDADAGRVVSVRTPAWRVFDVLWRFHILDFTGEDKFDTWWMKLAAFLGLTTVLFGVALLVQRAAKERLFR